MDNIVIFNDVLYNPVLLECNTIYNNCVGVMRTIATNGMRTT